MVVNSYNCFSSSKRKGESIQQNYLFYIFILEPESFHFYISYLKIKLRPIADKINSISFTFIIWFPVTNASFSCSSSLLARECFAVKCDNDVNPWTVQWYDSKNKLKIVAIEIARIIDKNIIFNLEYYILQVTKQLNTAKNSRFS